DAVFPSCATGAHSNCSELLDALSRRDNPVLLGDRPVILMAHADHDLAAARRGNMINHRHPDDRLVSAGNDGALSVDQENPVAIEARKVGERGLWSPPDIEDTGMELAAAVVERSQDVARRAPIGQHRLDLAAVAGSPLRLGRGRQIVYRCEAALDPA